MAAGSISRFSCKLVRSERIGLNKFARESNGLQAQSETMLDALLDVFSGVIGEGIELTCALSDRAMRVRSLRTSSGEAAFAATGALGPTLPSPAFTRDSGYKGISCRRGHVCAGNPLRDSQREPPRDQPYCPDLVKWPTLTDISIPPLNGER